MFRIVLEVGAERKISKLGLLTLGIITYLTWLILHPSIPILIPLDVCTYIIAKLHGVTSKPLDNL